MRGERRRLLRRWFGEYLNPPWTPDINWTWSLLNVLFMFNLGLVSREFDFQYKRLLRQSPRGFLKINHFCKFRGKKKRSFPLSISSVNFTKPAVFFTCELSINSKSEVDFKKIKNYRLAKYLSKVSYEDTNCCSRIFITEFRQAFSFSRYSKGSS